MSSLLNLFVLSDSFLILGARWLKIFMQANYTPFLYFVNLVPYVAERGWIYFWYFWCEYLSLVYIFPYF
jgi:hypothetical protein